MSRRRSMKLTQPAGCYHNPNQSPVSFHIRKVQSRYLKLYTKLRVTTFVTFKKMSVLHLFDGTRGVSRAFLEIFLFGGELVSTSTLISAVGTFISDCMRTCMWNQACSIT